jgi:hypothetical protein
MTWCPGTRAASSSGVVERLPRTRSTPGIEQLPLRAVAATEDVVKYLCLAYGAEADWKALDEKEQTELLAHDEVIRKRGALMAAVEPIVTTVRARDGKTVAVQGSIAHSDAPLAGFSVIEAADIDEVIRLVANTPCARANGAIEIRPIMFINDQDWRR